MTDVSSGPRLTGERTLPYIWHENYWFRRHEVVYAHLAELLAVGSPTARVLDAGCGEGYGSALLTAAVGGAVVGLDYDLPTLEHLGRTYDAVRPVKGNLVALPFPDASFDAVASLQVIEHIWEQPRFVRECVRVTRAGGWVALSTPNRLTFSPGVGRGEKPLNPFHVNELDPEELVDLLPGGLALDSLLGVNHGPRITAWEADHGSLVAAQLAEPYGSWPKNLVDVVRDLSADDFVLTPVAIEQSLDLVVVAVRD